MIKKWLTSVLHLFYPRVCNGCGGDLVTNEEHICLTCSAALVPSDYIAKKENRLHQQMIARVPIEEAAALYYFVNGSALQNLLHQVKYKGKRELGIHLGKILGNNLLAVDRYRKVDIILPIPLHANRLAERGYNQSQLLAEGMAEVMQKPVLTNGLLRSTATATQTNKSRVERWENVKDAFSLQNIDQLKGKHVLLVDDVITTGATLEAAARNLIEVEGIKVSIVALAYTDEL